ncbi:MAG: diguanylate cyclase [Deltaproteobacteria bacterium]|nr:diguanylate cyclase [Deltaproteobacteria bacterium]
MDLGRKYDLNKPQFTIGRSSKCDIQIDQESISRNHAVLVNDGKRVMVRDLGSTNGTYVNDQLVTEYEVRNGDFIKIGRTIFKFIAGGNIESEYHEEIYRLTTIDGLTQVFNKRYFTENSDREISRAHRYGRALTLIMFDIDNFKTINDSFGHLAGDHVLKQLASVVKTKIRREDVFSRYGGEEFAILLPELTLKGAATTAEKIRKLVESHKFIFEDETIPVTVSLGCAAVTKDIQDCAALIKAADDRLYAAKHAGRNKVMA